MAGFRRTSRDRCSQFQGQDTGVFRYQDKPITLIDARFTARDGVYRLDPLQSRSAINDAAILARIEIDSSSDPAAASLALQADNFDFGEIIKRLGISNDVAGTLTLRVDAKGKGTRR
jgi:hypothetical protein